MVNSSEFAKRLQKILDYYGLSATAFSDLIDFNRSTISHLLSGRNKPSLEFVLKVLEQFPEVELYWLLNGKGNFPTLSDPKQDSSKDAETFPSKNYINGPDEKKKESNPVSIVPTSEENEIDRIVIFYKDGTFKSYR